MFGAVGMAKQSVLMYLFGFPGFTSDWQPGLVRRLGKAHGSLLPRSCGSPSVPHVAVNGTPSFALKIVPSSQPDVAQPAGPDRDFASGTCQVALKTTVRRMSKSESPRLNLRSYQCKLDNAFEN